MYMIVYYYSIHVHVHLAAKLGGIFLKYGQEREFLLLYTHNIHYMKIIIIVSNLHKKNLTTEKNSKESHTYIHVHVRTCTCSCSPHIYSIHVHA